MAEENEKQPTTGQSQSAPPTGDAPGQQSGSGVTFNTEQQAAIDKLLGERLQRAREKWESEAKTAQEKAQQEAETTRLAEQQEFKTLAEKHAARVRELEPLAEQVKRYSDALATMLESQRKGLPAHIVALLDKVGDPLEQLTWLHENADKLAPPKAPDIDGTKQGASKKGAVDDAERERIFRRFGVQ